MLDIAASRKAFRDIVTSSKHFLYSSKHLANSQKKVVKQAVLQNLLDLGAL